jgi:hypothetical protein
MFADFEYAISHRKILDAFVRSVCQPTERLEHAFRWPHLFIGAVWFPIEATVLDLHALGKHPLGARHPPVEVAVDCEHFG